MGPLDRLFLHASICHTSLMTPTTFRCVPCCFIFLPNEIVGRNDLTEEFSTCSLKILLQHSPCQALLQRLWSAVIENVHLGTVKIAQWWKHFQTSRVWILRTHIKFQRSMVATCNYCLSRQRQRMPRASWLGRLAISATSEFDWETLPQWIM